MAGKNKSTALIVGVIVVAVLAILYLKPQTGSILPGGDDGTGTVVGEGDIDLSISSRDKYIVTASGGTVFYTIADGDLDYADTDGSQTRSQGKPYQILANGSDTFYPMLIDYSAPYELTDVVRIDLVNVGTVTGTFFNDNDAASTAISWGSGETRVAYIKYKVAENDGVGTDHPLCPGLAVCFDYNTTEFSEYKVLANPGSSIYTPAKVELAGIPQSQVGTSESCSELSVKSLEDNAEIKIAVQAKEKSGQTSITDATADLMDAVLQVGQDGAVFCAYNDEDGNNVGAADTAVTIDNT